MKTNILKIKSLFYRRILKPSFSLKRGVSSSFQGDELIQDVVKLVSDIYIGKYRVEEINLENTLAKYMLKGLIEVQIGYMNGEMRYVIKEPEISVDELSSIIEKIANGLNSDVSNTIQVEESVDMKLDKETYFYLKITSGLGPIAPLTLDPFIEDVFLSKEYKRIYVIHNKFPWTGWMKTNIVVEPELVDRLVISISRRVGKHISLVNPLAEGSYGDKFRASLVFGRAISPHGSSLVLRKRTCNTWTITKLIDDGVLTSIIAAYLWLILENRGWVIVAGHVGSGKTTVLQALLSLIPPYRKVITIEDIPEISYTSGLWDPLIEKSEVFSDSSQIDAFTLLKFALRRRPDYIVIGEVRGIEARLLVQASRLGHGVLNTIHADSPDSVLKRLMAPPISIPKNLLNNIWTIVVMTTDNSNKRRIGYLSEIDEKSSVIELCSGVDQLCSIQKIVNSSLRLQRRYLQEELYQDIVERAIFLESLVSKGIFSAKDLSKSILDFYNQGERRVFNIVKYPPGVSSEDIKVN